MYFVYLKKVLMKMGLAGVIGVGIGTAIHYNKRPVEQLINQFFLGLAIFIVLSFIIAFIVWFIKHRIGNNDGEL